jgi:hypothetical protein
MKRKTHSFATIFEGDKSLKVARVSMIYALVHSLSVEAEDKEEANFQFKSFSRKKYCKLKWRRACMHVWEAEGSRAVWRAIVVHVCELLSMPFHSHIIQLAKLENFSRTTKNCAHLSGMQMQNECVA